MCGILLLKGTSASQNIKKCLKILKHRGPDNTSIWTNNDISLGFVRLAINGEKSYGNQPYEYGKYVGVFNAEIYNHNDIRDKYNFIDDSKCDTQVILPLFANYIDKILSILDGFYSGVIIDQQKRQIYLIRDHIGKKPLFYGKSKENYFITSELKAINKIDWFQQVPLGLSVLNYDFNSLRILQQHKIFDFENDLYNLISNAVLKRIPSIDQKIGVFLSGGIDSSIIAYMANNMHPDVSYFVLGDENSCDMKMANLLINRYKLNNIIRVPLPRKEKLLKLIDQVVYYSESFNPSIISNGLATFLLSKEASKEGIKVVLSGEGADELFGGYHYHMDNTQWKNLQSNLINDMHFTELRRLDLCSMANSVEVRCPFLDQKVRHYAEQLKAKKIFELNRNKVILRKTFSDILPTEIINRKKISFDVGSGIRKLVVNYLTINNNTERESLYAIWKEKYPHYKPEEYFYAYPVLDSAIDKRGIGQ